MKSTLSAGEEPKQGTEVSDCVCSENLTSEVGFAFQTTQSAEARRYSGSVNIGDGAPLSRSLTLEKSSSSEFLCFSCFFHLSFKTMFANVY